MSKNIKFELMYHCQKLLDLIHFHNVEYFMAAFKLNLVSKVTL
jgi:hypothetical protein